MYVLRGGPRYTGSMHCVQHCCLWFTHGTWFTDTPWMPKGARYRLDTWLTVGKTLGLQTGCVAPMLAPGDHDVAFSCCGVYPYLCVGYVVMWPPLDLIYVVICTCG